MTDEELAEATHIPKKQVNERLSKLDEHKLILKEEPNIRSDSDTSDATLRLQVVYYQLLQYEFVLAVKFRMAKIEQYLRDQIKQSSSKPPLECSHCQKGYDQIVERMILKVAGIQLCESCQVEWADNHAMPLKMRLRGLIQPYKESEAERYSRMHKSRSAWDKLVTNTEKIGKFMIRENDLRIGDHDGKTRALFIPRSVYLRLVGEAAFHSLYLPAFKAAEADLPGELKLYIRMTTQAKTEGNVNFQCLDCQTIFPFKRAASLFHAPTAALLCPLCQPNRSDESNSNNLLSVRVVGHVQRAQKDVYKTFVAAQKRFNAQIRGIRSLVQRLEQYELPRRQSDRSSGVAGLNLSRTVSQRVQRVINLNRADGAGALLRVVPTGEGAPSRLVDLLRNAQRDPLPWMQGSSVVKKRPWSEIHSSARSSTETHADASTRDNNSNSNSNSSSRPVSLSQNSIPAATHSQEGVGSSDIRASAVLAAKYVQDYKAMYGDHHSNENFELDQLQYPGTEIMIQVLGTFGSKIQQFVLVQGAPIHILDVTSDYLDAMSDAEYLSYCSLCERAFLEYSKESRNAVQLV